MTRLVTKKQLAEMVFVDPQRFYKWTLYTPAIPKPNVTVGRRHYYDDAGVRAVIQAMNDLHLDNGVTPTGVRNKLFSKQESK
jgi:hypothetical protein